MGRRNGGRRSLQETLRSRVDSCISVNEIVNRLRCTYPDCQRMKLKDLTRFVHDHLQSRANQLPKNTPNQEEQQEARTITTASPRKRRRTITDESSSDWIHALSSSTASLLSSTEEEDSAAIYGDRKSPEPPVVDLMKMMLRDSYNNNNTGTMDYNVKTKKKNKKKKKKKEKAESEREVGNSSKVAAPNNEGGVVNDVEEEKKGPRFSDLGGMKHIIEKLRREVIVPLCRRRSWLRHVGGRPSSGLLLHGPPGCGKTQLAHAIACETGLPFYPISATDVVSGVSGASEENIRELFSKANKTAPSIVFIDEIDAIGSKRENLKRQMDNRIVTQLLTCMSSQSSSADGPRVLVIGATNRPDALDPALRRPGRFNREIAIGIPDKSAREDILSVIVRTGSMKLEGSVDLREIARSTQAFVGADLGDLANLAAFEAVNRVNDEMERELSEDGIKKLPEDWYKKEVELTEDIKDRLAIQMSDFEKAMEEIQPSQKREGFSTIPDVKWEDVGGLDALRKEFEHHIVNRIKDPELYEEIGVHREVGFLLYGPPGCGKTLIAKALANEAGANFIHVKGAELLNKYVGESEREVRTLFNRARTCAPCIIFFDEVDALTTRSREGGSVIERVMNQLLIELDGAGKQRGVFVIGATNKPEVMDRAFLRAGRFGEKIYVPLPTADERVSILKALARKMRINANVDLDAIARMEACENLSGADLAALMNKAANAAIKEKSSTIMRSHFNGPLSKVSPSLMETFESHISKNQDPSSIKIAMADLHKLRVVVEDANFYGRCCKILMDKNARELFCTIPDEDHKIIFLRSMASGD